MTAPDELLAELTRLADEAKASAVNAGRNLYLRLKKAGELLGDEEWIRRHHHGERDAAVAALGIRFFSDLYGSWHLHELLVGLQEVPEEEWESKLFDLRRIMTAAYRRSAARQRPKRDPHPTKRDLHEAEIRATEAEAKAEVVKAKAEQVKKVAKSAEQRVRELEQQVDELRKENASLKEQIKRLKRKLVAVPQ